MRHEGQILRTISAGQNLETKERTWLILREEGMVLEEAEEGADSTHNGGDGEWEEGELKEKFDEKDSLILDSPIAYI